jgi:hypothetical protein
MGQRDRWAGFVSFETWNGFDFGVFGFRSCPSEVRSHGGEE